MQTEVTRNYQKIQTLVAQLGGICNFMFLFGFLISKIENHYQLITLMSNELYIFPKITSKKKANLTQMLEKDLFATSIAKKNPKTKKIDFLKSPRQKAEPLHQVSGRKELNMVLSKFYEKPNTDRGHVCTIENEDNPNIASKTIINPHKIPSVPEISSSRTNKLAQKNFIEMEPPHSSFHESEENEKEEVESNTKIQKITSAKNFPELKSVDGSSPFSATKRRLKDRILSLMKNNNSESTLKSLNSENLLMGNLEQYQKLKKKENFFGLGFCNFFKILMKNRSFNLKNRDKLFLKAEEQVLGELDILQILKKLQEIEKLKRIFLTDDQLYLFNLLSKPMIVLENQERRESKYVVAGADDKRYKFSIKEKKSLQKETLSQLYGKMQTKAEKSEIDKRIMKLLDEDVMNFLTNEKIKE